MIAPQLIDLIGKVITLKTTQGHELVSLLAGVDQPNDQLTLMGTKQVVIAGDVVSIVPWTLTSEGTEIIVSLQHIFSIEKSLDSTEKDFRALVFPVAEVKE